MHSFSAIASCLPFYKMTFLWQVLIQYMHARLDVSFSNDKVALACILDPRCKNSVRTPDQRQTLLSSTLEKYFPDPDASIALTNLISSSSQSSAVRGNVQSDPRTTDGRREVYEYLSANPLSCGSDPLQYWKDHEFKYPKLARLARIALSASPSSVESQRLFSLMKLDYNHLRNRLSATKAGTLARVQSLMRYFGYKDTHTLFAEPLPVRQGVTDGVDIDAQAQDDSNSVAGEMDVNEANVDEEFTLDILEE